VIALIPCGCQGEERCSYHNTLLLKEHEKQHWLRRFSLRDQLGPLQKIRVKKKRPTHHYFDERKEQRGQIKRKLYLSQRRCCIGCRQKFAIGKLQIDHIWPVSRGGPDEEWNYQLLCQKCNYDKRAQHPIAFMQSLGFLV